MWSASQDGQDARKVAEGTRSTKYWVFDQAQVPVLRVDSLDARTERVMRKTGAGWVPLADISLNDEFTPLFDVRADGTILARSSRGRDLAALVTFDTQTGDETVGDETVVAVAAGADIGLPVYLSAAQQPDILRVSGLTPEYEALTPRGRQALDILADLPRSLELGPAQPTSAGRFVTLPVSAGGGPFVQKLLDLEKGRHTALNAPALQRFSERLPPPPAPCP